MKFFTQLIAFLASGWLCFPPLAFAQNNDGRQIVQCIGLPRDGDALMAALRSKAPVIELTGRKCVIARPIVIDRAISIIGLHGSTTILPIAPMTSLFEVISSQVDIKNVSFSNDRSMAEQAISYRKPYDNLPDHVQSSFFYGFRSAIYIHDGNAIEVDQDVFQNNRLAIEFANGGVNSSVTDSIIFGGSGISLDMIEQGPEGVILSKNKILPGTKGYCLQIKAGLSIEISSNVCDQVIEGDGISITSDHPIAEIKSELNWIGVGGTTKKADVGLNIVQTKFAIQNFKSVNDTFYGWNKSAIMLQDIRKNSRSKVTFEDVDFYFPGFPASANRNDVSVNNTDVCRVNDATFSRPDSVVLDDKSTCLIEGTEMTQRSLRRD